MTIVLPLLVLSLPGAPPSTELLHNAAGQNQRFASIGRLRAGSQCTASLIEPESATDASAALLLTAGHCISLDPYGVIIDRPVNFTVEFNYFIDTRNQAVTARVRRIVWSTMKGTDLALLELAASYGELRAKGIEGFRMATAAPVAGSAVFWVGAPSGNIPQGQAFLRRGECTVPGSTTVIEARWLWHDEIRIDCQDTYPGASGSPLFDAASGSVVGVIGTSTNLSFVGGPDYDCYRDRPCAVTSSGAVVEVETSYASPVADVSTCMDGTGGLNLGAPGCMLDRGEQLAIDVGTSIAVQPGTSWGARLSGNLPFYAWKGVQLGRGECREPSGYSAPMALADNPTIDAPIGVEGGDHLLCVVAGSSPVMDRSWQALRQASIRRKRVDAQPPIAIPEYEMMRVEAGYRLAFISFAPAIADVEIKQGPLSVTDCDDRSGYRMMISVPTLVRTASFPYRVCVWYADEAGNAAPPLKFDFGPPAFQPYGLRNAASLNGTRAVAPGSMFRIDTLEMPSDGIRLEVIDEAGATHPIPVVLARPEFIEARMPAAVRTGAARLRAILPDGSSLSTDLAIASSSPGIYAANMAGSGPALGYFVTSDGVAQPLAECAASEFYCEVKPITIAAGDVDIVLFGTGFPRDAAVVKVGTEEVRDPAVRANEYWPGVDEIRFRLATPFPLRGYQRIQVGSAATWVLLE